ncbi:MAG: hypothetical protein IJ619_10815 [Eubacterium sp.]|nr:hypothetical protein [Eubacterium sp.]
MKRKLLVPVLLLLSLTLGLTACGMKGKEKEETSEKKTDITDVTVKDENEPNGDDTSGVNNDKKGNTNFDLSKVERGPGEQAEMERMEQLLAGKLWVRDGDDADYTYGYYFTDKHTVLGMGSLGFNDAFYEGVWYVGYCGDFGFDYEKPDESFDYRILCAEGSLDFSGFIISSLSEDRLVIKRFHDDDDSAGTSYHVGPEPCVNLPDNVSNPQEFVEMWQYLEAGGEMNTLDGNGSAGIWYDITADGTIKEDGPYGTTYYHWAVDDDTFYWCSRKDRQKEAPYPFDDCRYSIRPYKYEKIDEHKYLLKDPWNGKEFWLQCR